MDVINKDFISILGLNEILAHSIRKGHTLYQLKRTEIN